MSVFFSKRLALWLALAAPASLLNGCAPAIVEAPAPVEPPRPAKTPSFYDSMASAGAKVDPVSARDMISLYRRNEGRESLTIDPVLMREAQRQADAMAASDKLSHEVRGTLTQRLNAEGLARARAVENVSAGYHTMAEAFSGWRQSKPHNANMLAPGMRRMGIATAYNPNSRFKVFWALVLAD